MVGRTPPANTRLQPSVEPRGFDDFQLRLGDVMRGERATMGKSLLDVQRELRIKAAYIAAIENCDPSAFDTPGFIAGYVRSYARYLGMDPDEAFAGFCAESGFTVAHGMSNDASARKKVAAERPVRAPRDKDPLMFPNTPFVPERDGLLSDFDPRAIGSALVLVALIGGIGYGGWSVLKEVQRVHVSPIDQTPAVLAELDPLDGATAPGGVGGPDTLANAEALDTLYRPQALDVPVLVARDAPISTLDPRNVGSFARPPSTPRIASADPSAETGDAISRAVTEALGIGPVTGVGLASGDAPSSTPQVRADAPPELRMVAVRPSWVRVSASDGSVLYEGIMEPGSSYQVPLTDEPPRLRAGESGAVYFAVNGVHYGPVGNRGVVTSNVPLSVDAVTERFTLADLDRDGDLARVVAEASTIDATD